MPWRPPSHRALTAPHATSDQHYNAERRQAHGPDPRSTARWRRVRARVLATHPLCSDPFGFHPGQIIPATQGDHRVGVWQRPDLVYDEANLSSICTRCHAHKNMLERSVP
jgi:hypothetical protein